MFEFTIRINCLDLTEVNGNLGNLTLNHPDKAMKLFQEVVYSTVVSLSLLSNCPSSAHVSVRLQLTALPNHPEYRMSRARDITKYKSFVRYTGVVISMSAVHKYTKNARYVCMTGSCEGSSGSRFIRVHIPGAREAQTIRNDFVCSLCKSVLVEDVTSRVLADKVIAELIDEKALSNSPGSVRYQSVTAFFRDELASAVQIGRSLNIIALPIFDSISGTLILEVNNIENDDVKDPDGFIERPIDDLSGLPSRVLRLYHKNTDSPWSFGLSLAYYFADCVTTAGTFYNLKLAMLLSLLSQSGRHLDLLAVGCDGVLLRRLVEHGALFASRRIIHTTGLRLLPTTARDRSRADLSITEAGSMLLACDGVCLIPDLTLVKKSEKEMLVHALETGIVPVDGGLTQTAVMAGQSRLLPNAIARRCTVWSTIDTNYQKNSTFKDCAESALRSFAGESVKTAKPSNPLAALVGMFDIVCMTDSKSDFSERLLAQDVLRRAAGFRCNTPLLTDEDVKTFVNHVARCTVKVGDEARHLIKGYYITRRRLRTMPVNAIETVTCLAESVAKLNLRSVVSVYDAVLAVHICEETLLQQTGFSALNVHPVVHMPSEQFDRCSDAKLHQFHKSLVHLLESHAINTSMFSEE